MRKRLFLLSMLLVALPATADVPPPPGYIETCTPALQCKKGEEADVCSAYHGDPDACQKKHKSTGFQFRCRTRGASVWSEVWCKPKGVAPTAPKQGPKAPISPVK